MPIIKQAMLREMGRCAQQDALLPIDAGKICAALRAEANQFLADGNILEARLNDHLIVAIAACSKRGLRLGSIAVGPKAFEQALERATTFSFDYWTCSTLNELALGLKDGQCRLSTMMRAWSVNLRSFFC
jgi:hypothetical protein